MIYSAIVRCIGYKDVYKNVTTHKAGDLLGERACLGVLLREGTKERQPGSAETRFAAFPRALPFLVSHKHGCLVAQH